MVGGERSSSDPRTSLHCLRPNTDGLKGVGGDVAFRCQTMAHFIIGKGLKGLDVIRADMNAWAERMQHDTN